MKPLSKEDKGLNISYGQIQGLFWLMSAISYAFMTPILQARGYSSTNIGILFSVRYLAQIFGQTLASSIADRYCHIIPLKIFTAIMTILSIVFTFIFLVTPGLAFPLLLWLFLGMGCTTFCLSPMIDALAMQFIEIGRRINYTLCRGIGSATWAIACIGIGNMMQQLGADSLLILQIVVELVMLIAILRFENINLNSCFVGKKENINYEKAHSPWYLIVHFPRYMWFLVSFCLLYFSYAFCTTFQIDVIKNLGGDNVFYGYAEFILAISEVPVVLFYEKIRNKIGINKILVMVMFFAMVKVGVQSFAPNLAIFAVAQIFEMLGFGMSYASVVYFVMDNIPAQDRVKGQGLVNVAAGIGSCLASFVSGRIYDIYGLEFLLVLGIGVGFMAVVTMWISIYSPITIKISNVAEI